MKLFKIHSINHGWLTFSVGDVSYTISYLSDFKEEMDYVFNLSNGQAKYIVLDMEDMGYLYVETFREGLFIYITLFGQLDTVKSSWVYCYEYKKFLASYREQIEKSKEWYFEKFAEDKENVEWDNEDYKQIKNMLEE